MISRCGTRAGPARVAVVLSTVVLVGASRAASGQFVYEQIATTRDVAPGAAEHFLRFNAPRLNEAGTVVFPALLERAAPSGPYPGGIWVKQAGGGPLQRVASLDYPVLVNDLGQVAFSIPFLETINVGTPGAVSPQTFLNAAGGAAIVPGANDLFRLHSAGRNGQFAVAVTHRNASLEYLSDDLYVGAPDAMVRVPATPLPGGQSADKGYGAAWINPQGRVAFLQYLGTGLAEHGLFYFNGASVFALGVSGGAVPGVPGATFLSGDSAGLFRVAQNGAQHLAFDGTYLGSDGNVHTGLFRRGAAGPTSLLAQTGDPVPGGGPQQKYSDLYRPTLAGDGTVYAHARIDDPAAHTNHDVIARWKPDGSTEIVVQDGGPVGGLVVSGFGDKAVNASGGLLFVSFLGATATSDSVSGMAIWAANPGQKPQMLMKSGDMLDVGGGDLRTILGFEIVGPSEGLYMPTGGTSDGQPVALTDSGLFAFRVDWDGGSSIITGSLAAIPEPAAVTVFGALALFVRRARRR